MVDITIAKRAFPACPSPITETKRTIPYQNPSLNLRARKRNAIMRHHRPLTISTDHNLRLRARLGQRIQLLLALEPSRQANAVIPRHVRRILDALGRPVIAQLPRQHRPNRHAQHAGLERAARKQQRVGLAARLALLPVERELCARPARHLPRAVLRVRLDALEARVGAARGLGAGHVVGRARGAGQVCDCAGLAAAFARGGVLGEGGGGEGGRCGEGGEVHGCCCSG